MVTNAFVGYLNNHTMNNIATTGVYVKINKYYTATVRNAQSLIDLLSDPNQLVSDVIEMVATNDECEFFVRDIENIIDEHNNKNVVMQEPTDMSWMYEPREPRKCDLEDDDTILKEYVFEVEYADARRVRGWSQKECKINARNLEQAEERLQKRFKKIFQYSLENINTI